jgi:hypothetical protein
MLVLRSMNWFELSPWLAAKRERPLSGVTRGARTGWIAWQFFTEQSASWLPVARHAKYFSMLLQFRVAVVAEMTRGGR